MEDIFATFSTKILTWSCGLSSLSMVVQRNRYILHPIAVIHRLLEQHYRKIIIEIVVSERRMLDDLLDLVFRAFGVVKRVRAHQHRQPFPRSGVRDDVGAVGRSKHHPRLHEGAAANDFAAGVLSGNERDLMGMILDVDHVAVDDPAHRHVAPRRSIILSCVKMSVCFKWQFCLISFN